MDVSLRSAPRAVGALALVLVCSWACSSTSERELPAYTPRPPKAHDPGPSLGATFGQAPSDAAGGIGHGNPNGGNNGMSGVSCKILDFAGETCAM